MNAKLIPALITLTLLASSCTTAPTQPRPPRYFLNGVGYHDPAEYRNAVDLFNITSTYKPDLDPDLIPQLSDVDLGLYAHLYIIDPPWPFSHSSDTRPRVDLPPLAPETKEAILATMADRGLTEEWLTAPTLEIGQTTLPMFALLGRPKASNKTTTRHGERIQWVYYKKDHLVPRIYVYTRDGIITAWQN